MEEIISRAEFQELMTKKGETKGVSIKDYGDYILKEKGKEGLARLERLITQAGFPISYSKIKPMSFYPVGLEGLTILGIQRLFDFDNEKIKEMGRVQAKVSILIRIFMKYFFSIRKTAEMVPKMWRSFYTVGEFKIIEFDESKKFGILRLESFRLIPTHCIYLTGYLASILQLIVGVPVICEETECTFRGGEYHEFLLKW